MQLEQTNSNQLSRASLADNRIAKTISESSDEEILRTLAYIISLIGVPAAAVPVGVSKTLMVSYIKTKWAATDISEMQTAFEWAVETQAKNSNGDSITNLFGRPFNVDYIRSVIMSYRESKRLKTKPINGMTNNQISMSIMAGLKKYCPDGYDKLKEMAINKPKVSIEAPVRSNDIFQVWIRQFDNLKRKFLHAERFIKIGQTVFNIDSFLERKLNNYNSK